MYSLRKSSRKFRYAYRELQKSGFYHGSDDGIELLDGSNDGAFRICDGYEEYCMLLKVSNYQSIISIGIIFDDNTEKFHLDESSLSSNKEIPMFESICDLVKNYEHDAIELNIDFAESIYGHEILRFEDVPKVFIDEDFLMENAGEIEIDVGMNIDAHCLIYLSNPISK